MRSFAGQVKSSIERIAGAEEFEAEDEDELLSIEFDAMEEDEEDENEEAVVTVENVVLEGALLVV